MLSACMPFLRYVAIAGAFVQNFVTCAAVVGASTGGVEGTMDGLIGLSQDVTLVLRLLVGR